MEFTLPAPAPDGEVERAAASDGAAFPKDEVAVALPPRPLPLGPLGPLLRPFVDILRSIDPGAAGICAVAAGAYTASHFEGSVGFFYGHLAKLINAGPFGDIVADCYWLLASNVLFGLIPFCALFLLREPREEYGLGLGDRRFGAQISLLFLAVMLPTCAYLAYTPSFHGAYPLNANAARDWPHFVLWEVLYVGYFIGWEFFHRSFLLIGLRRRIGNLAIFVAAVPFTLEHFGKPEPEAWGSFFAAILLGLLAIRARSFWYGAGIHGGVALFMDTFQSWSRLTHP